MKNTLALSYFWFIRVFLDFKNKTKTLSETIMSNSSMTNYKVETNRSGGGGAFFFLFVKNFIIFSRVSGRYLSLQRTLLGYGL